MSKSQIGFLPKHGTTDYVFTLVITCFIDFKKAFNSFEGLYYRLLHCGIGGKMYDLVKSMYSENMCVVKIDDKQLNSSPREEVYTRGAI